MPADASNRTAILNSVPSISEAAARQLHRGGMVALVAGLLYLYWTQSGDLLLGQWIAMGVVVVAAMPALAWAKARRTWFPAFEISMLTCIAFYAIPLFKSQDEIVMFSAEVRMQSSLAVLIYVGCASFVFAKTKLYARIPLWTRESLLPSGSLQWVHLGMFCNALYVWLSAYALVIPFEIDGALRSLFFGIGILSTFVIARLWGIGALTRGQQGFFLFNLLAYLILSFATLYLIGGVSTLLLAFISYTAARRKIPLVTITLCMTIVAMLHLGKSQMRKEHWLPELASFEAAPVSSLFDLPEYYSEWFTHSMTARTDEVEQGTGTIFDRASLIQMICLSVENVPTRAPFLYGSSYQTIPALFIPRFIWPEKPSALQANVELALYLGLVSVEGAHSVSIAFGPLAEAYLNFGYLGVAILGLLTGWFYKRVALASDGVPQFSALGIGMILLTAWSFQAEQIMATWISSLFQAAVICIGLPLAYRHFTTR